jgi:hypothetical protein
MEKIRESYRKVYDLEKGVGIFFADDHSKAEIFPELVSKIT